MRVVVLSRSSRIASTRRLLEAARKRGHQARSIDPTSLQLQLGQRGRLVRNFKLLKTPDLVISRFASPVAAFALPMVEQLETQGAVVLDRADAIGISRNVLRCLQRLSSASVPVLRTLLARDARALKAMVSRVGGLPVVVKLLAPGDVSRVMVCESMQSLEAALEAVLGLGFDVVMQESVRVGQQDLQLVVVGGRVRAAVRRVPGPGRAARNLKRYDFIEPVVVDASVEQLASAAARACGLEVCAVDVMQSHATAKVAAVSACPLLPELEAATGIDLANAIVEHGETLVAARAVRRTS